MRALCISHAFARPEHRGKLEAMAALGVDLQAAVPKRWRHDPLQPEIVTEWSTDANTRVAPVRVRGSGGPSDANWSTRELTRLALDFRPDVVHVEAEAHWPVSVSAVRAAGRAGAIVTLYATENLEHSRSWTERRRYRRTVSALAGAVGSSQGAARMLQRGAPSLSTAIMPQFGTVAPDHAVEFRPDRFQIGFVGRLARPKGLDVLLDGLSKLEFEQWRLLVVGDGPEREALEGLVSRKRLASRVEWLGALSDGDLRAIWDRLDALVVPSRRGLPWEEPVGEVAVHAMMHGVPVVASRAGALTDRVSDAGILIEPDDAAGLAQALGRLATQPDLRASLAKAARAAAISRFTDEAMAADLVAFWNRLVETRGGR